jgi:two-component system, OmpR family, phosphate regulon sensor histidine kinase PhoR
VDICKICGYQKMRINKLNIALLLGFVVIVGIMVIQFFLLRQALQYEEKKFAQKVHVALLEVASKLNVEGKTAASQTNPIDKIHNDYYIVNVNNKFEAASLDYYLKNEFEKFDLVTDYEYGYYDCTKECMTYGDYITLSKKENTTKINFELAKNNMAYYFVVHFPQLNKYLYKALNIWIILSLVMLVVLVLYGYSAFTILQQKKYAELQKDFINNMTHEFKTPISSILIASNFLDKQEAILQDQKLKKYTELIAQQAYKLNGHVEKILQLAKTENKSLTLQKTNVNIVAAIQTVVENILLKYPDADINVDAPAEYYIEADEFHFANLVYNLLDNAVKYAIKKPVILISIQAANKNIQLSFEDNGMGIPAKDLQHVFEKFYRVSHIKSNEINGFGLGLFYVNSICKEHKWKLSLKSIENKGTTVTILIPTHG